MFQGCSCAFQKRLGFQNVSMVIQGLQNVANKSNSGNLREKGLQEREKCFKCFQNVIGVSGG